MRLPATALLLATALLSGSAGAAPGCPMVADPVGDALGVAAGQRALVSDPAMDVESVNLVTDASRLKVQVTLNQHAAFDTYAPTGRLLDFEIAAKGGTPQHVRVVIDATGNLSSTPKPVNAASLRMEAATRSVWVAVPLSALGFHKLRHSTTRPRRTGDPFTTLRVTVYRYANGQAVGDPVDQAGGPLAPVYVHRAASCVRF